MEKEIRKLLSAIMMVTLLMMPMSTVAYGKTVGVEWVQNYATCGYGDLSATKSDAEGFYNALGNTGWTKKFDVGNGNAWESDFEKQAVGGSDYLKAINERISCNGSQYSCQMKLLSQVV